MRPLAYGYYLLTGEGLVVTSGVRKPKEQASLMYEKAERDASALSSLYSNPDLLGPIVKAYEEKTEAGAGKQATIDAMAAVIQDQVNQGKRISSHLSGRAFDVRNNTMSGCEKEAFEKVFRVVFVSAKLIKTEPGSEPHFHVEF